MFLGKLLGDCGLLTKTFSNEVRGSFVAYRLFFCVAFFVCTFVGNYAYEDFLIGPPAIFLSFLVFLLINKRFDFLFLVFSLLLSEFMLVSYIFSGGEDYYVSIFLFLSYSLLFSVLCKGDDFLGMTGFAFFSVVSLFFCGGMVYFGAQIGGRESFIFGPNNLYRVFGVCLAFIIFSEVKAGVFVSMARFFFSLVSALGIIFTGSRGGLVVLAVVSAIYMVRNTYRFSPISLLSLSILFALFVPFVYYQVDQSRLFNFSASQESISVRLEAYSALSKFSELSINKILFGYADFKKWTHIMPHNLILESVLAYGIVFSAILIFGFVLYFYFFFSRIKNISSSALCVETSLLVILVGSMFSGTFYDNYPGMLLSVMGMTFFISKVARST